MPPDSSNLDSLSNTVAFMVLLCHRTLASITYYDYLYMNMLQCLYICSEINAPRPLNTKKMAFVWQEILMSVSLCACVSSVHIGVKYS
jgi:hypothetical protein